ncbi:MAG TPA: type I methionyl aminopeptidase [Candidatus Limnocylindria bacterium]|nr:type I methionyl aminopeptidase [Candidatus Limnocylindria bacterium]
MVTLKNAEQIAKMREAGKIVAAMLAASRDAVKPGITTAQLDRIAADVLAKAGAASSFLGYYGYPATICTSVNEQIVHGIPSDRKLRAGDIVSIDAGAIVDGWHADGAITVPVGTVSAEAEKLIRVTRESLNRGIAAATVGNRLGDIGAAVQQYVESEGYSVVRNYVGHGIGRAMHEDPQVPNYGTADLGRAIKEGLCIAIEPMVNIGGIATRVLDDHWTVVTEDGSLSAHFEHTVACVAGGTVVLTRTDEVGSSAGREKAGAVA